MSRQHFSRVDRFAQMSKQEEVIAKKRQEILEKQKTVELAKKVAAAQSIASKLKTNGESSASDEMESSEPAPTTSNLIPGNQTKLKNTFCNDGSFLAHFKKILEQHKPAETPPTQTEDQTEPSTESPVEPQPEPAGTGLPTSVSVEQPPQQQQQIAQQQQQQQPQQQQTPTIVASMPPTEIPQQQSMTPNAYFNPNIPPPIMNLQVSVPPPPPPPPPPPVPLQQCIPPLYMIPPPEPLQLNTIPPPKELDLNAIPKPELNLDAIQVPSEMDQDNSNDSITLPTSLEMLIDMVADVGDAYEDKIRSLKNDIHPTLWFLFEKDSEQYISYRRAVEATRQQSHQPQQSENQHHQQPQFQHHHERRNQYEQKPIFQQQQQLPQQQRQQELSQQQQQKPEDKHEQQHEEEHQQQENIDGEQAKSSNSFDDKYDPECVMDRDEDSDDEYMRGMMDRNRDNLKRRIECRNELMEEERQREEKKRQRKSRWGEKSEEILPDVSALCTFANQNKPVLSAVQRTDPQLLQYARQNYGTTELEEDEWKKCEEHYKVNLLYQDMLRKRQEIDRLARTGKFKYEYDSDEDITGGTWEHKLRNAEMEATQAWATALTKQCEGKHHIGDFLPPEELKKFMEQYEAKKSNRQPDLSDYKEFKLREDNIGFQMLQKLGWKEGQGLGSSGTGIVDPVNKAPQRDGNQGLGVTSAADPEDCDNEYDAYRKRMMLAYRFRPNPLNNPRRAYY